LFFILFEAGAVRDLRVGHTKLLSGAPGKSACNQAERRFVRL
jgi:hypothetical protein